MVGETEVGRLFVRVMAKTSDFTREFDKVDRKVQSFTRKLNQDALSAPARTSSFRKTFDAAAGGITRARTKWNEMFYSFMSKHPRMAKSFDTLQTGAHKSFGKMGAGIAGLAKGMAGLGRLAGGVLFSLIQNTDAFKFASEAATDAVEYGFIFGVGRAAVWAGEQIYNAVVYHLTNMAQVGEGAWNLLVAGSEWFGSSLQTVGDIIGPQLAGAWDMMAGAATAAWEGIYTLAPEVFDAIGAAGEGVFNTLSSIGGDLWSGVQALWAGDFDGAWASISHAGETAWNGLRGVGETVYNGLGAAWGSITSTAGEIWKGIEQSGESMWAGLQGMGGGLWDGLGAAWGGITAAGGAIWSSVVSAASGAFDTIKNIAASTWEGLAGAAQGAWNFITGSKQFGGPIAGDGLYKLHRGEFVLPAGSAQGLARLMSFYGGAAGAGGTVSNSTQNVSAPIVVNVFQSHDVDPHGLGDEIGRGVRDRMGWAQ